MRRSTSAVVSSFAAAALVCLGAGPSAAAPANKNTSTDVLPCDEGAALTGTYITHAPNPLMFVDGRVTVQTAGSFSFTTILSSVGEDARVLQTVVDQGGDTRVPRAGGGTRTCTLTFGPDTSQPHVLTLEEAQLLGVDLRHVGTVVTVTTLDRFVFQVFEPGKASGRR